MAKDTNKDSKKESCNSCGDAGVMLTEEKNSAPRCAGCGKELKESK